MATSYIENIHPNNMTSICRTLTWKELRHIGRTITVPFKLALDGQDVTLYCEDVARLIPGNRLVAFGTWGDHQVVAKLFFEPGNAKRHLKREIEGVEALVSCGVPTPKLLWKGSSQKRKIQVMIFERIVGGMNLHDIWEDKNTPEELDVLMRGVMIELATQHVLGIMQNDLHLKNFLVTHKQIYTLDAGSVTAAPQILSKEESIDHLGLFFAQLGVGLEKFQDHLFQVYAQARGWIIKKSDIKLLKNAVRKWNEKRWENFEKKIQRNSTMFVRRSQFKALTMFDYSYHSAEFEEFLKNPDEFFAKSTILKAGRSSTVMTFKLGHRQFVVKRYNIKSPWHWLRRCLRQTRAFRSWKLAQQMQLFGIPTAKPVAFIETRFFGLRGKSYFVMEFIDGQDAGDYFANYQPGDEVKENMAKQIMALFANLAKLKLTHGDLKMTNILIKDDKPYLIDLDGMVEHKSIFSLRRAYKKELQRFMKNWVGHPTVQELFSREH